VLAVAVRVSIVAVCLNVHQTFLPPSVQVSRRLQHRLLLIHHLPCLLSLDGVMVSVEERQAADISFSAAEQQVGAK